MSTPKSNKCRWSNAQSRGAVDRRFALHQHVGRRRTGVFYDGISEDVITDLSKIGGLIVIARNSSFAYKGRSVDIRTVGRDLGVRSVLEGSIRRTGNRVKSPHSSSTSPTELTYGLTVMTAT